MKTLFRWPVALLIAWAGQPVDSAQAATPPNVQCRVSSSGEVREAEFAPQTDPLSMSATDLSNGFRFSGVLLEPGNKFKTYVYYESKDRYVLIARQELLLPTRQCGVGLGLNEVYSSYLENHLSYECTQPCSEKPAN